MEDPALLAPLPLELAALRHRVADLVVHLLKRAFEQHYGSIDDDAVIKITGAADKPLQLIRRYKNERNPNVAVTVDLLTTGVGCRTSLSCISKWLGGFCSRLLRLRTGKRSSAFRWHGFTHIF